jgi:hypothetical protein
LSFRFGTSLPPETAEPIQELTVIHLETFADDTAILARHDDPVTASHKLQGHLHQLEAWLK